MILLIDNYDSFTFNLVHYLQECGAEVHVFRNDAISVSEAFSLPKLSGIVISPGPCTPTEAGNTLALINENSHREKTIPLLGVCLGHQAIAQNFGGNIIRAPQPIHGKVSEIFHAGENIFNNIPSPFIATRYHSLLVEEETFPAELSITARTEDNLIMALSHRTKPIFGVQFHPESIASTNGHLLLKNFLGYCA
jgi:anthranilate synthase component 2